MFKNNLVKKIIALIAALSIIIASAVLFPVFSGAAELTENKEYAAEDGEIFVVDHINNEYWVVSSGRWHRCIYNSDSRLSALVGDIRQAMYNRDPDYFAYFIIENKYIDTTGVTDTEAFKTEYLSTLFSNICSWVYEDNVTPYGGDYLKQLTYQIKLCENSGFLEASNKSDEYSFLRIELSFEYKSTAHQEQQVKDFLEEWNQYYILDNPVIQSSSGNEKEYYIVKTIYNYLTKNTAYDMDLYEDSDHTIYPTDSVRYLVSHTAYGALFGNVDGSFDSDFEYKTFSYFDEESNLNVYDYKIDLAYASADGDNQGLYRINKLNQGRAVCDGYALAFYYLCKLNNIDCKIVFGDYTAETGKGPDPHAWNEVYLRDCLDDDYEWYYVDATFGSQFTQKISNEFSVTDYDYFLRGSENKYFSPEKHQQSLDEEDYVNVSREDYRFVLKGVDLSKAYAVVTRRRNEDRNLEFVSDGVYNLENYIIIDSNGNFNKIKKFKLLADGSAEEVDETEKEEPNATYFYKYDIVADGFNYYGGNDGYWYSFEFYDFAEGVEYICDDLKLKESGTYPFEIKNTTDLSVIANRFVTVAPLDMGSWNNYDRNLTEYPTRAYFNGADIEVSAEIYDSSKTKLEYEKDFILYCYKKGDASMTHIAPHDPGEYVIRIEYYGNYKGVLEAPFIVLKYDLSMLEGADVNATYGSDIEQSLTTFKLGTTTLYKDKDYSVSVRGGREYLDSGDVIITALSGSKYLQKNTQTVWKYYISNRNYIADLFDGKTISGERYTYTGSQIRPEGFTLSYVSNGKTITLVKDKDYSIIEYGSNVDAGTGTVTVEFIGNYKGTATLKFIIEKPTKFSVSISELTYNGKTQYPSPKVSYNGMTLVKGVDYTVSGSAKAPGVYTCIVQGIGNFSKVSGKYSYFVKPGTVTNLKKTSASSSKIKLSWTAQGGVASYQVYAYDSKKKVWYKIAQTSSNSCTVSSVYYGGKKTALKPASKYQLRVRAFYTANNGAIAKYGSFSSISAYTLPKTPSVKKITRSKNTLKVNWSKDSAVTGYQIYIANNSKFTSGKKSVTVKKNSTIAYTFKGLKKGKTYYVRMRSYKKVGNSTYYSAYSKTVKVKL